MAAIGGHHRPNRGLSDDWLTPPALVRALGPFDLDPCAAVGQPWPTAATQWTRVDDGLSRDWFGTVWLNPPYSAVWQWIDRLADHGDGIGLVFARTETRWFFSAVFDRADALYFLRGRLSFLWPDGSPASGNSGAPSVLAAYGPVAVGRLRRLDENPGFSGKLVVLR